MSKISINLTNKPVHDNCTEPPTKEKDCGEKHTQRVANATLEIAIDIHTDFDCGDN